MASAALSRRLHRRLATQRRVTVTLVTIVLSFFILIFPSELVQYYLEIYSWLHNKPTSRVAVFNSIVTCNMLQAIFMSNNFILYCVVNSNFRRTLRNMLPCCSGAKAGDYNALAASNVQLTTTSMMCTELWICALNCWNVQWGVDKCTELWTCSMNYEHVYWTVNICTDLAICALNWKYVHWKLVHWTVYWIVNMCTEL